MEFRDVPNEIKMRFCAGSYLYQNPNLEPIASQVSTVESRNFRIPLLTISFRNITRNECRNTFSHILCELF